MAPAPNDSTLIRFLLGTLPDAELGTVQAWLANDPRAAQALADLRARDLVTDALDARALAETSDAQFADTQPQVVQPVVPAGLPERVGGYAIERELGRGGMGVVYAARDPYLPRRVAVKVIADDAVSDPDARARFRKEAEAVSRIDHPNVVPVFAFGEDAGRPFLVMPLLLGETLADRLRRGPLSTGELVRLASEVAAALEAAHAAGVIHRDIKPANVWLDAGTGRARVLDFGLAKSQEAHGHTASGAIMGSAHYMSPQQANGQPVDARTDLFSLGALLYHAATGKRPFEGDTVFAVLRSVVETTPPDPAALASDVPPRLAALIRKLLAKEPAARPASATDVLVELADPPPQPPQPPKRKFPVRALAAALLLALAGAAAVVYEVKFANGTLVVEASDEADVRLKNGTIEVYEGGALKYALAPGARDAKLPAGTYQLKVTGADGVELEADTFALKRNEKVIVRVTAKPAPVVAATPAAVAPASGPDRRAAEWALSVGGTVEVSANGARRPVANKEQLPAGPFQLVSVTLSRNGKATDAGLAAFAGCKHVRELYIDITNLGSGIEHFRDCTELEVFHAIRSHVRDEHLAHLKNCTKLQVAELGGCGALTDSGLAHLDTKGLKRLNLNGTGVTNAGLARFADCKGLIRLEVEATRVTDAGLEPFRDHTGFELLKFEGLPLTDAVLEWVAKNEKLTYLNLNASRVTDAGLARLHGLKRLTELHLGKTKVTAPGVAALAKALPNCKIAWDGPVLPAGAFGRAEFPTYTRVAQIGTHDRRHRAVIDHMDAAPQWNRLATVAVDGLKVWELGSLKLVAEVVRLDEKQPLPLACALVGPSAVAVLERDGETGITLYDVAQKPAKVLRRLPATQMNFARDVAASPNREWVAYAHDEQVELWKTADLLAEGGKPAHLISGQPSRRDFEPHGTMQFAPDGKRFAVKVEKAVRTFALANGRWAEGATVPVPGPQVSYTFGPRGETLLVSCFPEKQQERTCEQWDIAEKKPKLLASRRAPSNYTPALSLLDDGRLCFASSELQITSLPLKPDADMQQLKVEYRHFPSFELRSVGGGAFVARDGARVRRFRVAADKLEEQLAEPTDTNEFGRSSGSAVRVRFATGRVALVGAGPLYPVRVWGIDGARPELLFETRDTPRGVRNAVLSADGKEVFIGGNNELLSIWAVGPDREPLVRFWISSRDHSPLGLSADGKYALTFKGRAVFVWDRADTNQPIFEHKLSDTQWPTSAHPGPGGWFVPVMDIKPADNHQLVPLTIETNNGKPTARAGAPLVCNQFDAAAPATAALGLRWDRAKARSWRFVVADLEKNPPAEREVPLPAELQERFRDYRLPSLSPDGTRAAVLDSDGRTDVGFVAVVDLKTGKLIWEHKFGGQVMSAEFVGPNRLLVLHRNGVVEFVEPKIAPPK